MNTLSPVKEALLAAGALHRKMGLADRLRRSSVAIVGMACRFPGGAETPEKFWQLLESGKEAITEFPADRFGSANVFESDPDAPGKTYLRRGGVLPSIDGFDAAFFRISPREAARMDPQQRLFLELSWEALEDAGIPPASLRGSRTAVYAGVHASGYAHVAEGRIDRVDSHYSTGVDGSYIAGRVAYFLGLHGPAMAVDTACSSSLTAVHLACQSLRDGESKLAIAGGVKLILSPHLSIFLSKTRAMSPTGRCRAFDAGADGMVQGEGCGVVVLKRLDDALRDGDRILAVLRSSAVNHDGPSSGLTVPNPRAQAMLMQDALDRAGVDPAAVGYVEAHGTGTPLGDPAELSGLAEVYCRNRRHPLRVGSVKTNIGHTESAAGIAGLIKAVLILRHGAIPPSLHFKKPNPAFAWNEWPLEIATKAQPLALNGDRPLVAVSSFGMSGVNAHAILEAAPEERAERGDPDRGPFLLPLSAHTPEALRAVALRMTGALSDGEAVPISDICYTAGARRSHHAYRLAATGGTAEQIREQLTAYCAGETKAGLVTGRAQNGFAAQAVFVFSGQGPQWWAMGRKLFEEDETFRRHAEACDAHFQRVAGWSILREMLAPEHESRMHDTEVAQPALFVLQTALAAMWARFGVKPAAVVGHSSGEVAAAYVAGIYTLEDALRLAYHRGRVMQRISGHGAMAAVRMSEEDARQAIAGKEDRLAVAAVNGPASTVLSGERDALAEVLNRLRAQRIASDQISNIYAFHSPQIESLQQPLEDAIGALSVSEPVIPLYSTVRGAEVHGGNEFAAEYWKANIRQTVRFHAAVKAMLSDGYRTFVEISPHPVLAPAISESCEEHGSDYVVVASLHRKNEDRVAIRRALGRLYCRGCAVSFNTLHPGGRLAALPAYPWQRERYWLEQGKGSTRADQAHPLLGQAVHTATQRGVCFWNAEIAVDAMPWLRDHRIQSRVAFPGVLSLEMAMEAAAQVFGTDQIAIEDIAFHATLTVGDDAAPVQLILKRTSKSDAEFEIVRRDGEEEWTPLVSGRLRVSEDDVDLPELPPELMLSSCGRNESGESFYRRTSDRGIDYGPLFRGIEQLWLQDGEAIASLRTPAGGRRGFRLTPGLFDACLHASLALADGPMVPSGIARFRLYRVPDPETRLWSRVVLEPKQRADGETLTATVKLIDEQGDVLMSAEGLLLQRPRSRAAELISDLRWEPQRVAESSEAEPAPETWILFSDGAGVGAELHGLLKRRACCITVRPGGGFAQTGAHEYEVDPASARDFSRLFEAVASMPERRIGIVHLWSLDSTGSKDLAGLRAAYLRVCGAIVCMIQGLGQAELGKTLRLWMVTRNAVAAGTGDYEIDVAQAPVWGLGRTIAYEQPDVQCTLVDVDSGSESETAHMLASELTAGRREDEVALRGDGRYLPRLARANLSSQVRPVFRADATYLITGGFGGIGLKLAEWLIANGARSIALAGRRVNTSVAEQLKASAGAGLAVHMFAIDVSQPGEVSGMLRELAKIAPPLKGIFNSAGVLDDGALLEMTPERFAPVARPKVDGAWNLHSLTQGHELDHFVMFSSTASVIGSPGQSSYAAVNAFLDALAQRRRRAGLPGLSINWGAWSEVGMAAAESNRGERLAARGMRSMDPGEALEALGLALQTSDPQRIIARFSAEEWLRYYPQRAHSPLLRGLVPQSRSANTDQRVPAAATQRNLRAELESVDSLSERRRLLESFVREQIGQVTELVSGNIDSGAEFLALGIDSLMAIELRSRILASLEVSPPLQRFLRDASVTRLTNDLLDRLALSGSTLSSPAAAAVQEDLEHISI